MGAEKSLHSFSWYIILIRYWEMKHPPKIRKCHYFNFKIFQIPDYKNVSPNNSNRNIILYWEKLNLLDCALTDNDPAIFQK